MGRFKIAPLFLHSRGAILGGGRGIRYSMGIGGRVEVEVLASAGSAGAVTILRGGEGRFRPLSSHITKPVKASSAEWHGATLAYLRLLPNLLPSGRIRANEFHDFI